jgi:small conductance mechanosensitive channel|tara:strand:+ start:80384 stop:81205 length:822 start_codon:yes stop_codon:yes gene_type:complete
MVEKFLGISSEELYKIIINKSVNLLVAIAILVIGFWLAKFISKIIRKGMKKGDLDAGLVSFISSLVGSILKVLVVITAMTQIGIEMTSFIAILGAAGLAIGLAFSGTLSNFAGGVMVLIFKPFKVGDFIQAQGELGVVNEIQIFNTYLMTTDNKTVIIPNGPLANGNIVNFTKADKRRVDFTFGIAYGDDYDVAKATLIKFFKDDKRILEDPAPFIGLGALADSSVNITVRAWTEVGDYWPVFFDLNERVYKEFGKEGLNFPFPQMDVHMQKQ